MTVFLDTSALVRRYVAEAGRDLVLSTMDGDPTWVASALARTEVLMTLHHVAPGPVMAERLWSAFRDDWDAFAVVPVDARCLVRAAEIGAEFGVRVVDAVHLAAADRLPRPVRYVTFDRRQIPGATSLGLEVVSPLE